MATMCKPEPRTQRTARPTGEKFDAKQAVARMMARNPKVMAKLAE